MSDKIDGKWKTWNPFIGCLHSCSYCWAKKCALERLGNTEKYKDGFAPKLAENELSKRFRNQFVFVSDMGNLFGQWVPESGYFKSFHQREIHHQATFCFLQRTLVDTKNLFIYVKVTLYWERP